MARCAVVIGHTNYFWFYDYDAQLKITLKEKLKTLQIFENKLLSVKGSISGKLEKLIY